jgi:hypothetical protein
MSLIEDVHEEGSMAWTSRGVKAQEGDEHQITVVSPTMMYYRWVALDLEDEKRNEELSLAIRCNDLSVTI